MKARTLWAISAALAAPVSAQIQLPPGMDLAGTYSSVTPGLASAPVALDFAPDGQTALFGVNGNQPNSALFSAPVLRDPATSRVVGFGAPTFVAVTPYLDAGLVIGPNGRRFFSEFPVTDLGEIINGAAVHHALPANIGTTGGLAFIPAGLPGAGSLLVSSFSGNQVFKVTTTVGPQGELIPQSATVYATLPVNLLEGIRFIPNGPYAGDLLVADFNSPSGTLWRVDIDPATGEPVGGPNANAATPLIQNAPALDGIAFDPITNDLFLTDWNGFVITHLTGLQSLDALVASDDTLSASGQTLFFQWRCGTPNAFKYYTLVMGGSGSFPGVDVGPLHVPINPDFITFSALNLYGQFPFIAFESFTGLYGSAASALVVTPNAVSPSAAGFELTFCGVLTDAFDFATNPVTITIVP